MEESAEAVAIGEHEELKASCESDNDLRRMEDVLLESDEFHDITCYPCSKDGRNAGAVRYCVDCKHHMCDRCLAQHNRFDIMKNHNLVENDKRCTSKTMLGLPTQKCSKHHGKLLEMYCWGHDEVCCVVCVAVDHSRCLQMEYIPNFAEQRTSETLSQSKNIFHKISLLEKTFGVGIEKKKQAEDTLQAEKNEIHNKVDIIRQLLNKRLDVLQESLLGNLEEKYEKNKSIIDVGKHVLIDAVTMLRKEMSDLTTIMSDGNDSSKFVQVKIADKSISEVRGLQESVAAESTVHVFFRPDTTTSSLIYGIKSIGSIVAKPSCLTLGEKEIVNVCCSTDRTVPTISGICTQNNGLILMTDWENSSLKCIDQDYNIKDTFLLPEQPYDICCIDDNTVAVSITNIRSVQYVETRGKLSLSSSFKTGAACRGIAFYGDHLYVACGGNRLKKEGRGHIEVYNISGKPLKILSENVSYPGHVFVARSKVYVADSLNTLVIFDLEGKCLNCCNYRNMVNPMSVSDGPEGQIFLGGWTSHNVVVLTERGHYVKSILDKEDGVHNLHTIFFDWLRCNLICTMRDSQSAIMYNIQSKQ